MKSPKRLFCTISLPQPVGVTTHPRSIIQTEVQLFKMFDKNIFIKYLLTDNL